MLSPLCPPTPKYTKCPSPCPPRPQSAEGLGLL